MGSVALMLSSMAFFVADAPSEAVKAEWKKLQGTWLLVSSEREGVKKPEPRALWVFEENRAKVHFTPKPANVDTKNWTFKPEPINLMLTYHFKFDPAAAPKTLERQTQYKSEKNPSESKQIAIYKLDGDTLTICVAGYYDKGKHPTDFVTTKGSDRTMYVLKREKP